MLCSAGEDGRDGRVLTIEFPKFRDNGRQRRGQKEVAGGTLPAGMWR